MSMEKQNGWRVTMDYEKTLEDWFDAYVPSMGKADTVGGEIVRAFSRINYRSYNDGDSIGVGYGNETCNAAARYLIENTDNAVAKEIEFLWGHEYDYDNLVGLRIKVVDFLTENAYLFSTPNNTDMFSYREPEDLEYDDDDDWE